MSRPRTCSSSRCSTRRGTPRSPGRAGSAPPLQGYSGIIWIVGTIQIKFTVRPAPRAAALALLCFRCQVRDAPHDQRGGGGAGATAAGGPSKRPPYRGNQPARNVMGFLLGGERGERDFSDVCPRDPHVCLFVVEGVGVIDRCPRIVVDRFAHSFDGGGQAHCDRHIGACGERGADARVAVERGLCRGPGYADVGARSVAWGGDRPAEVGIVRELRGRRGVGRRAPGSAPRWTRDSGRQTSRR